MNVISIVVNHDDTVDKKMLDVPDFYRMFTSNWQTAADSLVARYTQSLLKADIGET